MNTIEPEERLTQLVIEHLKDFVEETSIEFHTIDENTRLIGSKSIFDSLDLVTFIVSLEELLQDNYGIDVILTDEKAISRQTSPFINPATLARFISEIQSGIDE